MQQSDSENFENPTQAIEAAIDKLALFIKSPKNSVKVSDQKGIKFLKNNLLHRVGTLAWHFIAPLFSDQALSEREKRIVQLKEEILQARDILQSHTLLIEKLKKGDVKQQKLAHSALEAINRYNEIVGNQDASWASRYDISNFERNQILLDQEIKGQKIELPHALSIHFESHTPSRPIMNSFKDLSNTFLKNSLGNFAHLNPTYKKSNQFMTDTFRMKAVRMIQSHQTHRHSVGEIIHLIKQTPIEVHEEKQEGENLIYMRQVIEEFPGCTMILTGTFKNLATDSKFMRMPILESFHLATQVAHEGFPYPCQYTGWAISEALVQSYPLRADQAPLFLQADQQRKRLAHSLLYDPIFTQKSRAIFELKKEIFDENCELFLSYHQDLHESILRAANGYSSNAAKILDDFYKVMRTTGSAFNLLNHIQQKLNMLFIKQPASLLEEEWLNVTGNFLRKGSPQEKLHIATNFLINEQKKTLMHLNLLDPIEAFLHLLGKIMGENAQRIILQYFSEKIGFVPPVLSDFQQKIQVCAFMQLLSFLDEFKEENSNFTKESIKAKMMKSFESDIQIFQKETIEEMKHLATKIVLELEIYFPMRHYARYERKSYLPAHL